MQPQKTIHICLISDNLLPNLIPLLAEPPEAVQLVVTEGMKKKGLPQRFRKILAQQEIQVIEPDQSCPETGLNEILEKALKLAYQLEGQYPQRRIILNATGGTKLMALGFVEVFRSSNAEIIYTDTGKTQIEFLDKSKRPPVEMKDVINVPLYLAAYGFTVRSNASDTTDWEKRVNTRKPLTEYFASKAKELVKFFGAINALANNSLDDKGKELVNAAQTFNQPLRGEWHTAMQKIAESKYDLATWDQAQQITFHNADAARYLRGIWLEEYVWYIVRDAKPFDVQCSVEGTWEEGHKSDLPRNEFDILVTHRNRLLVIECKTARFGRDEGRDQDILYKLDALGTKAKGLFGATWLISARRLTGDAHSRASSQNIKVIEVEQLANLRQEVLDWMGV